MVWVWVVYGFSVLANMADQYTTYVGIKSGKFKEANPFRFSKNSTVDALVKIVALPLGGLVLGLFFISWLGVVYNVIYGGGIAVAAVRNYWMEKHG